MADGRKASREWRVIAENDEPSTAVGKGHRALRYIWTREARAMMYLGSTPRNTVLGGVMPYAAVIVVIMIFREMNPISITKKSQILTVTGLLGHPSCRHWCRRARLRKTEGPFFLGLQKPKTKFSSSTEGKADSSCDVFAFAIDQCSEKASPVVGRRTRVSESP